MMTRLEALVSMSQILMRMRHPNVHVMHDADVANHISQASRDIAELVHDVSDDELYDVRNELLRRYGIG